MNIIVSGFQGLSHQPILYNILTEFKVANCHIIYDSIKIEVPSFTNIYFYNHHKFLYNGPDKSELQGIEPIGTNLIKSMSFHESLVLKMMDRWYLYPRHYKPEFETYKYRKEIYLNNLKFWNNLIERNKFEIAIFDNIPHLSYDYIIFALCKLKNIPVITLYQTDIIDTLIYFNDFDEPSLELKEKYNSLHKEMEMKSEEEINLSNKFLQNFKQQTEKDLDPTPFYMIKEQSKKENKQIARAKALLKAANPIKKNKDLNLKDLKNFYVRSKLNRTLTEYYTNLVVDPDLNKKFIYVGLHYQPERSTSPQAGIFTDQNIIIQYLSKVIPEDIQIYVKEHPNQTSLCRSKEFYDELISYKNVSLISKRFNTYDLINNSLMVVTCSGTLGWEALFREKPVLLFGVNYYQYSKGVFVIKNIDDCANAVDLIINEGVRPTLKDIKIFLKTLELITIEGYMDDGYKEVSRLTPEQNIKNLSKVLIDKIKSIRK